MPAAASAGAAAAGAQSSAASAQAAGRVSVDTVVIATNAFVVLVARVVDQLIGYGLFLLIAARIGEAGLGQYAFVYGACSIALALSHQGLETHVLWEASRDAAAGGRVALHAMVLKGSVALLAFGTAWAWGTSLGRGPWVDRALALACVSSWIATVGYVAQQLLVAREMMYVTAALRLVERVTALALGWWLLERGAGLPGVALALLVSECLVQALCLLVLRRVAPLSGPLSFAMLHDTFAAALPFAFSGLFLLVYVRIPPVLIALLASDREAGLFAAAARVPEIVWFLALSLMAAAYPRLVRTFREDRAEHERTARAIAGALIELAVPAAVGLWWVAAGLVALLYGASFEASSAVLRALAPLAGMLPVNTFLGNLLEARERKLWLTVVLACACAANLAASAFVIPRLGAVGAAYVLVATEALVTVALLVALGARVRALAPARSLARAAAAALVMLGVLAALGARPVLVQVATGVLAYGAAWSLLPGRRSGANVR